MKTIFTQLAFVICLLAVSTSLFANFIIVKGHIKYNNGSPVANHVVNVSTDSIANPTCYRIYTKVTDSAGFYIDTLTCKADITKVTVTTEDCNGSILTNTPAITQVPNYVESNFILSCVPPNTQPPITPNPIKCWDSIFYSIFPTTSATSLAYIKFNSKTSVTTGDSVISHLWNFGDSSSLLTGNRIDPYHQYANAGIYNACLSIKTAKGCESKVCTSVTVPNSNAGNFIIVKGYVKYNNGTPVRKHSVKVSVDSTANPNCYYIHSKITDSTGFYIDTLTCKSPIKKVIVTTEDCNGIMIINNPSVTLGTNYVISNFTFNCTPVPVTPAPVTCSDSIFYFIQSSATSQLSYVKFNSKTSLTPGDSVTSRTWNFGDSTALLTGNRIDPYHQYTNAGIYNACLSIKTAKGCESKVCTSVTVPNSNTGNFIIVKGYVKYNNGTPVRKRSVKVSVDSTANPNCYYIHSKTTDSTGFYIDTLTCKSPIKKVIVTTEDCNGIMIINSPAITPGVNYAVSNFIVSCTPPVTPIPIKCTVSITYSSTQFPVVKFNSKSSVISGDSVISRIWNFGDSSTLLTGNNIDPSHQYNNPGIYNACLTIKTAKGCESKACIYVVVLKSNTTCKAEFDYIRILYKKAAFNSSASIVIPGDSIVQCNWTFGDGTTISSNEISPEKEFPLQGIYTVCLKIKTAKGCESERCITVAIQDSAISAPGATDKAIKIISLNPNPVITQFAATVWSKLNNVNADFSIYDIYGIKKWSTQKVLQQGNNVISIYTGALTMGPYFLRVSTAYGFESRAFYKL